MSSDDADSYESDEEIPVVETKKRRTKKGKDPNKPKRNMSAFFLYSNANRARVKEENSGIKFGRIAQILSEEFKAISTDERAEWDVAARKDKERYEREMEDYEPPSDLDEGPSKRKKKDPNAPKRNMSAYFIYSNATRSDVREANPEAKFGDIARIISANWKQLGEKDKKKYDALAVEDKERYQRQMAEYNA
jgi:high mobility group protein B2